MNTNKSTSIRGGDSRVSRSVHAASLPVSFHSAASDDGRRGGALSVASFALRAPRGVGSRRAFTAAASFARASARIRGRGRRGGERRERSSRGAAGSDRVLYALFRASTISRCAGRPFFANKPCWRPLQMFLPAFDTVTVIGYSSTRFGTTFAPAWTLWMADLAALNSCCPPSQFYAWGGNGGEERKRRVRTSAVERREDAAERRI